MNGLMCMYRCNILVLIKSLSTAMLIISYNLIKCCIMLLFEFVSREKSANLSYQFDSVFHKS